jgi:chaperonin cofactor prefoldin
MNFDRKLHALQAEYLKTEGEVKRLIKLIEQLNTELAEIKPNRRTREVSYFDFDSVAKFNEFIRDKEITLERDEGNIIITYSGVESDDEIAQRKSHIEKRIQDIQDRALRIQLKKLEELTKQLDEYKP